MVDQDTEEVVGDVICQGCGCSFTAGLNTFQFDHDERKWVHYCERKTETPEEYKKRTKSDYDKTNEERKKEDLEWQQYQEWIKKKKANRS